MPFPPLLALRLSFIGDLTFFTNSSVVYPKLGAFGRDSGAWKYGGTSEAHEDCQYDKDCLIIITGAEQQIGLHAR